MPLERVSQGFKDISMTFQRNPLNGNLLALKTESAIARSIRNIVQTLPGERFFNNTIGSNLTTSLFDFVDYGTASTVETQIYNSVVNYEPRADNVRVEVSPRFDENAFDITVYFDIIGQDFPQQEFNYILEATRR